MAGLSVGHLVVCCGLLACGGVQAQESRPSSRPVKPVEPDRPDKPDKSDKPDRPDRQPPAWTLDRLLAAFKTLPGLTATFKEEKRIALLAEPLVNEGTIHFAPPLRMVRHTTKPSPSTVLIDETRLQVSDGARTESIPLDRHPVVRQLVNGFLPVLRGDRKALEKHYTVTFTLVDRKAERWKLKLVPRGGAMAKVIKAIAFQGKALVFTTMQIDEVGGDSTVTTFSKVDVTKRFTAAELKTVFRLPRRKKAKR